MQELLHKLDQTASETEFSGVISLFVDASTVFNKAYGYRDIKNGLSNTTSTKFGIASGAKLFTALGIGVLVERGLVSLETTVAEIDRQYTGFIAPHATIQHLLTHTSGIFDYYDEEVEQDFEHLSVEIPWSELETPSAYFPLFVDKPMKFSPGERYSYSNGGYVFLGMIIERLTGRLYRDFIQDLVLAPAGMPGSGFFAFNDLPGNTASGYLEDRKTTNIYHLPLRGGGDGGIYTTSDDLLSFWDSLFSHKILPPELTDKFLQTHHAFNQADGYACGLYKRLDGSLYSIEGSDAGVGFGSWYQPREKLVINLFSNITAGESRIRRVVLDFLG